MLSKRRLKMLLNLEALDPIPPHSRKGSRQAMFRHGLWFAVDQSTALLTYETSFSFAVSLASVRLKHPVFALSF